MTAPVQLAIVGTVKFGEVSKEKLLEFWTGVVQSTGLQVNFEAADRASCATATASSCRPTARYSARSVLLAMGRRGAAQARRAGRGHSEGGVPAGSTRGSSTAARRCWWSAAATARWRRHRVGGQPGTRVTLSYRSAAFSRVKAKNRERVDALRTSGSLEVLLESSVNEIGVREVKIAQGGRRWRAPTMR